MSLLNQNIRASPHAIKDHNQGLFSLSKKFLRPQCPELPFIESAEDVFWHKYSKFRNCTVVSDGADDDEYKNEDEFDDGVK